MKENIYIVTALDSGQEVHVTVYGNIVPVNDVHDILMKGLNNSGRLNIQNVTSSYTSNSAAPKRKALHEKFSDVFDAVLSLSAESISSERRTQFNADPAVRKIVEALNAADLASKNRDFTEPRTYSSWKVLGRNVRAGETSSIENSSGKALFSFKQTVPTIQRICATYNAEKAKEGIHTVFADVGMQETLRKLSSYRPDFIIMDDIVPDKTKGSCQGCPRATGFGAK